jgi:hypothetical protein
VSRSAHYRHPAKSIKHYPSTSSIRPTVLPTKTKIHRMSLFPIIPQPPQPHHTMLASSAIQHNEPAQYQTSSAISHPHIAHCRQHLASALAHMFNPISHQRYPPSPTSPYRMDDYNTRITVDDEFVLLEENAEKDGGPLCREATIESWKVMTKDRKRRLSVHCFGKA